MLLYTLNGPNTEMIWNGSKTKCKSTEWIMAFDHTVDIHCVYHVSLSVMFMVCVYPQWSAILHRWHWCFYIHSLLGIPFCELREHFGEEFFGLCFEENERVLRAVGGNLQDFFNGFDAILEHIRTSTGRRASSESPSFQCKDPLEEKGRRKMDKVGERGGRGKVLLLHCFNPAPVVGLVMPGLIRAVARRIFHSEIEVEEVPPLTPLLPNEDTEHADGDSTTPTPTASPTASPPSSPSPPSLFPTTVPTVCLSFQIQEICPSSLPNSASVNTKRPPHSLSTNPGDLRIGLATFCRAFPFHLVLGPRMELLQLGEGLRRQARTEPHRSLSFRDCFEIVSPKMEPSFQGILLRLASPFTIRTRPDFTQSGTKEKVMISYLTNDVSVLILLNLQEWHYTRKEVVCMMSYATIWKMKSLYLIQMAILQGRVKSRLPLKVVMRWFRIDDNGWRHS